MSKKSIDELKPGVDYFADIHDLLGTMDPTWSPRKVKELLRSMIESGIIYSWSEARLYRFLLSRGLLNLQNRYRDFFRDLSRASKTERGQKLIEQHANDDKQFPPDQIFIKPKTERSDTNVEDQEIKKGGKLILDPNADPLEEDEHIRTVQQILKNTDFLTSIHIDEEAMKFYVNYEVQELWKLVFKKGKEQLTVEELRRERKTNNRYRNEVVTQFLKEYDGTDKIVIPKEILKYYPKPFLMQKYVGYKVAASTYFGNFSGTGAGKTLSAIIASRIIESKMTIIICPNDVVEHWVKNINEIYENTPNTEIIIKPDAKCNLTSPIIHRKKIYGEKYESDKAKYIVINWDTIQQKQLKLDMLNFLKQKIDFVILDEVHFSKISNQKNISERRKNLTAFLKYSRKKNRKLKTLGLSATPVVNNLTEGKSLIQLLSNIDFQDQDTKATVPNAVLLHEKIVNMSIRQIPDYPIMVDRQFVEVETERPRGIQLKVLHKYPLAIEQFLTAARIPEIINRIDGPTIIYSEYVGTAFGPKKPSIIQQLEEAVKAAGYTYDFYTGERHDGLHKFLKKQVQVLIASRPISTGVDGLQKVCQNLIFNTLPWTSALYEQIIGRVVRTGQVGTVVNIHHVKATIGGYPYDETKLDRIKYKRTLADCAVDGRLPERTLVTPKQAIKAAREWLARLDRGEFSSVTRREIAAPLTIEEVNTYKRELSDFSEFNRQIDVSKSSTIFKKWKKDPTQFKVYHHTYGEERKKWTVIPFEEIIEKIKGFTERYLIGDFGCGEAFLYKKFGNRVTSIDMVAVGPEVSVADLSDVSQHVKNEGLDVVVFSLSLMCDKRSWPKYIKEANRCLPKNGLMFVVVPTEQLKRPRLSNLREVIVENGFEIDQDVQKGEPSFTFIDARKV